MDSQFKAATVRLCLLYISEEPSRVRYISKLLDLLKLILSVGKGFKTLVEEMITTVTQGTLFKASEDKSIPAMIKTSTYVSDKDVFYMKDVRQHSVPAEHFRSFCQEVVGQVPFVARCLLPTVTAISEKIISGQTQSFLCSILFLVLSGESITMGDEGN